MSNKKALLYWRIAATIPFLGVLFLIVFAILFAQGSGR